MGFVATGKIKKTTLKGSDNWEVLVNTQKGDFVINVNASVMKLIVRANAPNEVKGEKYTLSGPLQEKNVTITIG